eukprot:GHRR01036152.1.p1 GENE.GHRR01036152.1~~GHRR01036152.1.p1  ORF type:complete len:101 (+),score=16.54 GHRR01036152.1:424-726(+)
MGNQLQGSGISQLLAVQLIKNSIQGAVVSHLSEAFVQSPCELAVCHGFLEPAFGNDILPAAAVKHKYCYKPQKYVQLETLLLCICSLLFMVYSAALCMHL